MKRVIQFFAVTLICVLTAGPAWAAVSCALGDSAAGASCPMGMAQMDADCPMSHAMAAANCSQDCCNRATPQATGFLAFPSKPRLLSTAFAVENPMVLASSTSSVSPRPTSLVKADSPPRYILLRVFRI